VVTDVADKELEKQLGLNKVRNILSPLGTPRGTTGVTTERMRCAGKERAVAWAKALFCYLAVREYGYAGMEAGGPYRGQV
jgi:hypothetical protein